MNKIEEIINNNKNLITENYFEAQKELEKTYGKNTVLLVQIGSFYEIYGTETIGKAKEISKILNIALTKKNKSIVETTEKNPEMCGFPDLAIDKHLEKLVSENKWNIAIINQIGTGNNVKRILDKIVSPGTNIDYLSDEYNFIASIDIEKTKEGITFGGISLIDVSIGKTLLFESYSTNQDKNYAIDKLKDIINKYNISELIISYYGFKEEEIKNIFDLNIEIHIKKTEELKKELEINYQNNLFKNSFNLNSFLSPIEELDLERSCNLSLSLSNLITFIIEHNYNLSKELQMPEFLNENKYLYLGNNPLSQLNINEGKYSLEKIINKGITSIGKRYIKEQLFNPLKDLNEINKRFFILELYMKKDIKIEDNLKNIYDIERIWRKIKTDRVNPFEVYNLNKSIKEVLNIQELYKKEIKELYKEKTTKEMKEILKIINNNFIIEKLAYFNLNNITSSFIKEGVNKKLDLLNEEMKNKINELLNVAILFEKIIDPKYEIKESYSLKESKKIFNNINISYNESEGYYIEISKRKYEDNKIEIEKIIEKDSKIKKLNSSIKIYMPKMNNISDQIIILENKIINLNKSIFKEVLKKIEDKIDIHEVALIIGESEFYLNNKNLVNLYNYKIPEIIESEKSFIDIKNLRHPIIERFESNGIFIDNDIVLGNKKYHREYNQELLQGEEEVNGLLLYGLNSSGKTTLSKALGISIIMGQAGMPISGSGRFSLFESIFTRITGDDDLERGLSTFAVEMLDLKNILNRSNDKSLILGDEISHGTETISGLSIVSATVLELIEKGSLFLFATHLHQLRNVEELNKERKIKDIHLSVFYNEKDDELIYDRKLKSGSGSSLYGLEFSKYLKLPESFLKRAYKIRNTIAEDLTELELLTKNRKSKYNSNHIMTICEICGKEAEDVHHINEKHKADQFGLIEGINKNHKFNLVNLCKEHHIMVHKGKINIKGYTKTSSGFKLDFEEDKENA